MHIRTASRRGQLSGWKAAAVAVVVVGAIGARVWFKMQPRSVAKGTWTIEPGHFHADAVRASQTSKMKIEFTPQSAGNYSIFVVDEANQAKLTTEDPDKITKLASQEGNGRLVISQLNVGPGTYYIVALNTGESAINVTYSITELRN